MKLIATLQTTMRQPPHQGRLFDAPTRPAVRIDGPSGFAPVPPMRASIEVMTTYRGFVIWREHGHLWFQRQADLQHGIHQPANMECAYRAIDLLIGGNPWD